MNKPQLTPPAITPGLPARPTSAARPANGAPRRNGSHPGDYLRLRLQYGHKGTRPLARTV
jgi:hypothetical protein